MKRCPSCGEENTDRARFCQACATPLAEADAPAADVRKVVTIVFADVTGSTALGERLDPEALRRVMGRYFDRMAAVIERHGGTVEKFIGDAVMAVFGIPRLHEDDALRAVRAAAEMRDALAVLNRELEDEHGVGLLARIGVNTGEVVAGDPSTGQRLVTGDAVNVAARLEQAATPGDVLLGEVTRHLVKDAVEVDGVAPLELKGKSDRVRAFRLVAVQADAAGHERRLDSPMVGREKELEMLERALDRAVTERTSHLFTLLGPAGVGKSRLVHEFLTGARPTATVLRGRCLSYGDAITYYPLAEVVQEAAGVDQVDDLATARAKLTSLLSGAELADRIEPLVSGILSWAEPGAVDDASWAVRKLFEHLARDRPLVVVFDDIHWAEPAFLDLIEHLADWTRDAALLLVCVARPELLEIRPEWAGGKLNATSILLEPLDGDAASTLVDNLLGRADIPAVARARILEAAEGNPLFVEEMLGMLIDDGLLRFEDGVWRAASDLADVTVPPTIQLLLAARLDRLDSEERAVIERGAVEGKVFHAGAVSTLASEALRPNVPTRLLALARKELIRPDRAEFAGEDAFRFRHLLIRDAAYHAMPKEQRAELHERFASWLAAAAGDRVAEYEEILGHHLEQAYRYRSELGIADERTQALAASAADRLMRSADRAIAREDFRSARSLLARATELATGRPRVEALLALAFSESELHDFHAMRSHAQGAADEATSLGERVLAIRAQLRLAEAIGQIDPNVPLTETSVMIARLREELEGLGDVAAVVEAMLAEARHEFYLGHCDRARAIVERLLADVDRLSPADRREIAIQLTVTAYFGSTPVDDALELHDRAQELMPGGIVSDAVLDHALGVLLALAGREDEAVAALERSDGGWAEIANPGLEVTRYQGRGEAYLHLGYVDEAERSFRRGVEILDSLGETGFNSTMTALHATVLCHLGRFDEAEVAARRSLELSAEDDFASQVEWRRALAWVLSARGEHDDAIRLIDEAAATIDRTDYAHFRAETHSIRGLVLRNAGRIDDARAAYRTALALFARKGAVLAAGRTRAALDELA